MPGITQVNTNTKGIAQHSYDAIVIGSGISGGWAAKELCEKGLKTLVLERGRNIEHIKDYPTMNTPSGSFVIAGRSQKQLEENPFISKAGRLEESTQHFYQKDKDHPYIQEKPFEWIRGHQVGGKSLIWGVPVHDGVNLISLLRYVMVMQLIGRAHK
jgi:choline dehydrogenase-like flavoprotein